MCKRLASCEQKHLLTFSDSAFRAVCNLYRQSGDCTERRSTLDWNLDPHRTERVSENIREELDELIGYEMSDPRVGPVTVAEVLLSPDFRRAHVRLILEGSAEEQATTLDALTHAKQFLRHALAERLQLFHTPDLHFEAALPASLGAKVPQILKRIKRGRPRTEKNPIS
jgi:ribosome-binding factor A